MTDEQEKQPAEPPAIPPIEPAVEAPPGLKPSWYSTHKLWILWDLLIGFFGCIAFSWLLFLINTGYPFIYATISLNFVAVLITLIFRRWFIAIGILAMFFIIVLPLLLALQSCLSAGFHW